MALSEDGAKAVILSAAKDLAPSVDATRRRRSPLDRQDV
jgi:hypothetical protein